MSRAIENLSSDLRTNKGEAAQILNARLSSLCLSVIRSLCLSCVIKISNDFDFFEGLHVAPP